MAKRKTTTDFNAMPVGIIERAGKLAVQIPASLNDGWEPATAIQIKKTGEIVKVKRGTGDDLIKGTRASYIEIELELADKLGWDKGTILLLQLDSDTITLKEPEGIDFCLGNLYDSFLFVRLMKGEGTVSAIADLGEQCGMTFGTHQLSRWRAGGSPPNKAINIMTSEVMAAVLNWEFDPKHIAVLQRGTQLVCKERE